jgi:hypothetical protein
MICFEQRQACMIPPTNSDNGELAFRALLDKLWGDTVTPWEWGGHGDVHRCEQKAAVASAPERMFFVGG